MNNFYDVVVVGGRVADCSLASSLAQHGVKVCVLERGDSQDEPVSTHIIFKPTIDRLVNQVGVDHAQLMSSRAPGLPGITFEVEKSVEVTFPFPDPAYCIRRGLMDNAIAAAARKAGADIRLDCRVTGILNNGHRITGVKTTAGEVHARFVVGADGVVSTIARGVNAEAWLDIPSDRCCYFSYYQRVEELPNDLLMFCFDNAPEPCGYLIFPTGEDQILSGYFPSDTHVEKFKNDPQGALTEQLLSFSRTAAYLKGVQTDRVYSRNTMPSYIRRSVGPGWALVGDAGHFKDPVMAQGIGDSVKHALSLSAALKKALENPHEEQCILSAWEKERDLDSIDILFMGVQMSRRAGPGPMVAQMLENAVADPKLRPVMGGIYQRTHTPADFFNLNTIFRGARGAIQQKRAKTSSILAEVIDGGKAQFTLNKIKRQIKSRPIRPWTLTEKL